MRRRWSARSRDRNLALRAILLTHHHADHVGGVEALVAARPEERLRVYGPAGEAIAGVTDRLVEGDRIAVDAIGLSFDVLDVPGHTRGHIAYVSLPTGDEAPVLFCGDTLFAAGCGRLFEGTAAQMHESLAKLAALPGATKVHCAHEYTLANLRFANAVEPDNDALRRRIADATALRERGEPTLPSTIELERATNPFLRADEASVRRAVERQVAHDTGDAAHDAASSVATFAALRRWKDAF